MTTLTTTTTTTATRTMSPHRESPLPRSTLADRARLERLKDELELFGWRPQDTARYARQALRALPLHAVIALFSELIAEERAYYSLHTCLLDDQLDHTAVAG